MEWINTPFQNSAQHDSSGMQQYLSINPSISFLSLIQNGFQSTKGKATIWASHQHREMNPTQNDLGHGRKLGYLMGTNANRLGWGCLVMWSSGKTISVSLKGQKTRNDRSHCSDQPHQSGTGNERRHCIILKSRLISLLSCYQSTLQRLALTWPGSIIPPVRLTPTALFARSPEGKLWAGFLPTKLISAHVSSVKRSPSSSSSLLPRRSGAIGHSIDVGNTFLLENAFGLTYLVTNMTHSCSRERHPWISWGKHSSKKSPRLLISWHSACVCGGLVERRVEAEMLVAVMCVGRNAPVLSLRLSYARMVRWKPLPGTVCRASASLCTGLNTHSAPFLTGTQTRMHTHTHNEVLPWRSSNYTEWRGGSQTQGGLTSRVIAHTYRTSHPAPHLLYLAFICGSFSPTEGRGVREANWREKVYLKRKRFFFSNHDLSSVSYQVSKES